jgi:hypothetical protein
MEPFLLSSMPFAPSPDTVSRRLGDTAVLIRLTTNRIYELNATGARVWDLVQADCSVDDIVNTLAGEFEGPRGIIRRDVESILDELMSEGLVVAR